MDRTTHNNSRKGTTITILLILAIIAIAAMFFRVDVRDNGALPDVDVSVQDKGALPKYELQKTQDGRLPDVDVDVKGQVRAPDVDVKAPDVNVKTEKRVIEVPTGVDVDAPEGSAADEAAEGVNRATEGEANDGR
jgi:hypothetical protein